MASLCSSAFANAPCFFTLSLSLPRGKAGKQESIRKQTCQRTLAWIKSVVLYFENRDPAALGRRVVSPSLCECQQRANAVPSEFYGGQSCSQHWGHVLPFFTNLRQNDLLMSLVMTAVSMAHLLTVGSSSTEHCRNPILNFNVSLNLGTPLELTHFSMSNKSLRKLCRLK